MSILRNLAKIKETREKNKVKYTRCDIDLSISDTTASEKKLNGEPQPQSSEKDNKTPSHFETNLGVLDYEAAKKATLESKKTKRGSYQTYSAAERFNIKIFIKIGPEDDRIIINP